MPISQKQRTRPDKILVSKGAHFNKQRFRIAHYRRWHHSRPEAAPEQLTKKAKLIVVTNDDGIYSPGLKAAVQGVLPLGEVVVVAPSHQQTGAGRGLFGEKNARLQPIDYQVNQKTVKAYHCDCSPDLIIRHALRTIFRDSKPDLLISGINYGENLGINITSSGTIGAALEGASSEIPSIALSKQTDIASHQNYTEQDWSAAIHVLQTFARRLLCGELPAKIDLWKIDVPDRATQATPWKLTRLARTSYYHKVIEAPTIHTRIGEGELVTRVDEEKVAPDSDIHAIAIDQMVSVTPITLDLTAPVSFSQLQRTLDA